MNSNSKMCKNEKKVFSQIVQSNSGKESIRYNTYTILNGVRVKLEIERAVGGTSLKTYSLPKIFDTSIKFPR